jgi:hypothetical protein
MKVFLKFNHDSEHTLKALDCPYSSEELSKKIDEIVHRFIKDDSLGNLSHLAELMHNEVDYSAILYMANKYVAQRIEQIMVKRMLRDMLNDDGDEII